jgi:hypothetical protein
VRRCNLRIAGVPAVAAACCAGVDDIVHDDRRYRVVRRSVERD